ncbi:hypothetical protein JOC70_002278 [Clostridium pascui]|uniref:hypothetical protein n=1 Tax=Clostridium pascui TaxID=46609 RepID=UPI00195AC4B6|nr:hypothetical protein [Clostridium pascui]MBM7870784.1 hypothetical protein [Clostridium pascui]
MKFNKKYFLVLVVAILFFSGCSKFSNTTLRKEVVIDTKLQESLNTFFTYFSEANIKDFKENELTEEEMINFSVYYNFIHAFDKFTVIKERCCALIESKYVKESESYFFGKQASKHKSTSQYELLDNRYKVFLANKGQLTISKTDKLYDLGNGEYLAELSIYNVNGFEEDLKGIFEELKKGDSKFIKIKGKKIAKIKKINENGNERFILLSYETEQAK